MLLYPVHIEAIGFCIAIPTLFEIFRILIAYIFGGPLTSQKRKLELERLDVQTELATIKSVQLELVRHSRLERKVIKIDKELEKLQESQVPKAKRIRYILRIVRVLVLIGASVYFGTTTIVQISPQVVWPFSFLTSEPLIGLHPWFIILVSCGTARHILRSILPIFSSPDSFP